MDIRITPALLNGVVDAPASKSFAHRMLICAALADRKSVIKINATSKDIEATAQCLRILGADITTDGDEWSIIPPEHFPQRATFDCGESGSTLRFMIPVAAALGIDATFTGHGRLPQRPVDELLKAMKKNGITASDSFPIKISGKLKSGEYEIQGNVSSQYITGLLLALPLCEGESKIKLIPPIESKPYIDMTLSVLKQFGVQIIEKNNEFVVKGQTYKGGNYIAEGDWSNGAFWLASGVMVKGLDNTSLQGDRKFVEVLKLLGAVQIKNENGLKFDVSHFNGIRVDASDIPDLVPVIAALSATAKGKTVIYNAQRLRIKESDRIKTTVAMINNLGGCAVETDDRIEIDGVQCLGGGTVDSFNDHRIVMATAVAASRCANEVVIKNAQAVEKSYPKFFKEYNLLGGIANVL